MSDRQKEKVATYIGYALGATIIFGGMILQGIKLQ